MLNFHALNLPEAHERPEAMEEASVMMVGLNPERILQGLVQLQYQKTGLSTQQINEFYPERSRRTTNQPERNFRPVGDYSMPNVSDKVVKIILGYTDYVKRTVWNETSYTV